MKLFDTRAGEIRDFVPLEANRVSIYVCGPTVQSAPHIGHLRSALVYDQLARWMEHRGYRVTLVRNVTDIDDKVLEKAQEADKAWWALALENERAFNADYQRLAIQPPAYEPRATGHIPQMIELIQKLIDSGHAYQALDGSANVYFDTASWPQYGELTNQGLDQMLAEGSSPDKKRAEDFALWKALKASEPDTAGWQTPWGFGRPGWHIECSAMATRYLGEHFDIHGGGLDLRFPHHENELAQSQAAGHKFANYWIHNGLITTGGQKMSKSLGNSVTSQDLFALASASAVRYYLLSAHYRSVLDYQPAVLQEAQTALERLHGFLERAERELENTRFASLEQADLPGEFSSELDDDLNIPAALAVMHDLARAGNSDLDAERIREAHEKRCQLNAMLEVLCLSPSQWTTQASDEHRALDTLMAGLIQERNQARLNKDYARADQIRDQLTASGIELFDTSDSTHWRLTDG
jgi:cysteinyl-tRNA synthetase